MAKKPMPIMDRRDFLKWSGGVAAAAATFPMMPGEFVHASSLPEPPAGRRTLQAA